MRLGAGPAVARIRRGEVYHAPKNTTPPHASSLIRSSADARTRGLRIGLSPTKFVEIVGPAPRSPLVWAVSFTRSTIETLAAHPLFASFVRAAHENRMRNETAMDKSEDPESLVHDRERAGVAGDD